jgi:hypothetical protein
MSYNRFALERVGGLEIIYNRRGQVVDIFMVCKRRDITKTNKIFK